MKTHDYTCLLEQQILSAKRFAKNDPITIYTNPSDKDKLELCSHFYSSGLVSLYITFLKSDNISFETLKDLTYKVCFLGIDGLLIGKEKK